MHHRQYCKVTVWNDCTTVQSFQQLLSVFNNCAWVKILQVSENVKGSFEVKIYCVHVTGCNSVKHFKFILRIYL